MRIIKTAITAKAAVIIATLLMPSILQITMITISPIKNSKLIAASNLPKRYV